MVAVVVLDGPVRPHRGDPGGVGEEVDDTRCPPLLIDLPVVAGDASLQRSNSAISSVLSNNIYNDMITARVHGSYDQASIGWGQWLIDGQGGLIGPSPV